MKRFGQVPGSNGEFGSFRVITDGVVVSRTLLTELVNRLEARISRNESPMTDAQTLGDIRAIDQARKIIR